MTPPKPANRYALRGDVDADTGLTADAFEAKVEASWHTCQIDRKLLKQLMQRSDAAGLRHFGLWLALLLAGGVAVVLSWGSAWAVPALAFYGLMYACSDHYAHELSHGTPFKTRWMNEVMLRLCGFMTLHEVHYWRWSHTRHHTHTMVVGRDPEIAVPRPPSLLAIASDLFFIHSGWGQIRMLVSHAFGRITADGQHFIPDGERPRVIFGARVFVAIFLVVIGACVAFQSWLPAMLVVLPRFYGGVLAQLLNLTQHAGMPEDIHDHRQICRTWHAHPVIAFLYGNMNFHVEHHMFPMVPFHALPRLHEAIRSQCPPAYPGLLACWREILPALLRQRRDPDHAVRRQMPEALAESLPA